MDFEQLGRKELQALAKQYKIKANQSNAALVEALKNAIISDYENSIIEDDEIMLDDKVVEEQVVEVAPIPAVIEVAAIAKPEEVIMESEAVIGKKRKGAPVAEVSGPFSVESVVVETGSPLFNRAALQQQQQLPTKFILEKKVISQDMLKIGDKVQVCIDSVWITSVIKRVNKASFRVQMDSGEEATVKPADIRAEEEEQPVEASEEDTEAQDHTTEIVQSVISTEVCADSVPTDVPAEMDLSRNVEDIFEDIPADQVCDEYRMDDSLVMDQSVVIDEDEQLAVPVHVPTVAFAEKLIQSPVGRKQSRRATASAPGTPSVVSTRHSIAVSTPSAARSAHKTATATPSRASLSVQQPWNSSTKASFHVGSNTTTTTGKTPASDIKKRKSVTARAASSPSRIQATASTANGGQNPAILPKMNAAQRMRLEALQKKKDAEKSMVASANPAHAVAFTLAANTNAAGGASNTANQPPLKKARTVPTPLSVGPTTNAHGSFSKSTDRTKPQTHHLPNVATVKPKIQMAMVLEDEAKKIEPAVTAKQVSVKTATASAAPRKTTTPNFERMHQKAFEKQKALTSCVSRDAKINKNMDSAFAKATTTATTAAAATTEAKDDENRPASNSATSTSSAKAFVTKRKAHVAFECRDSIARKDSDHLGSLLSGSGATPGRASTAAVAMATAENDQPPVAKKVKLATSSENNKDKVKTWSVAEKTTAAAVASKAIVLSRKSELANTNKFNPLNSRKSIRL